MRCLLLRAGIGLWLLGWSPTLAQTGPDSRDAWNRLQRLPLTESTFRQSCDFIQDLGQTDLPLAYQLLAEYASKVRETGNCRWMHVLLINWGKAKESLYQFAEADSLFRLARQNARRCGPKANTDALTYSAYLFYNWEKPDSLARYLAEGENAARAAHDRETLSLLRTFRGWTYAKTEQIEPMRANFNAAIRLARGLPDKNALFLALNSRASHALTTPQEQVMAFDSLLELANDPSLSRNPRFYERTTVYFRSPRPTVLFKLAQLNLLLTDYENAGKFADMFYDVHVRPHPKAPFVPYSNAEMAIVRAYQGQFAQARAFLDSSRNQFGGDEAGIPYSGYFLAAGLLAEHDGNPAKAAESYRLALSKGPAAGSFSQVPLELYHVRALTRAGRLSQARRILDSLTSTANANRLSAIGLYFYQAVADLHKAQGDYPGYGAALNTYYAIRDSLTNLNQYRAVQQILAKVRLRDKEQQIERMRAEEKAQAEKVRRERRFYFALFGLAALAIGLLALLLRNRLIRSQQREALHQSEVERLEKQTRIERMQGAMQAEESERRKLADQLHDEVAGMLALATLQISSTLENGLADGPSEQRLRKTEAVLTDVSATVRQISHRLTPLAIEQHGFRHAVEELAGAISLSGKLRVTPLLVGFDQDKTYPVSFLNDLYRIIQELLQNVLKHAQATEATVELVEHENFVSLLVEDNGRGLPEALEPGQGLRTIQARVARFNGQMEVVPRPEGGTMVVIEMGSSRAV